MKNEKNEITIEGIDFNLLREQKDVLINLQYRTNPDGNNVVRTKEFEAIEGIINLIDHIQYLAVEQLGLPEEEVFKLTNEE